MLATRVFARPATQFRKFHCSAPFRNEKPPEPMGEMINVVEDTISINRASAPAAVQLPYQILQSWKPSTLYSPLDFLRSRRIMAHKHYPRRPSVGPGAKEALYNDAFRQLDINPLSEVNNKQLLGGFVSSMGKIQSRAQTGLSWRSQRMVARAIKRAKQKGILPILSRS